MISNLALLAIEIVLLSEYAYINQNTSDAIVIGYLNSVRLILAGEVFMMVGFLVVFATYFIQHKFICFANIALLVLGFVLATFGMIFGVKYYENTYDSFAATWWIELAILLLGLLNFKDSYDMLEKKAEDANYQRQD